MILIPYDRFEIETTLSPTEAEQLIRSLIVPTPSFSELWRIRLERLYSQPGTERFLGSVDSKGFELRRLISNRNSFRPVVKGHMEPGIGGTKIQMTMMLHPFVMAFLFLWFLGMGAAAVTMTPRFFTGDAGLESVIPAVLFVAFWVVVLLSYGIEARRAKQILRTALRARH